MKEDPKIREFLLAHGGPFYELQRQLGLIHENALRAVPRALLFVGLAWGVPLVISLVQDRAIGPVQAQPFLLDPGVWARFFIAVGLFILMERHVEERLRTTLAQFVRAPIIAPESVGAAAAAVTEALKQRDSRIAEAACLAIASLATVFTYLNVSGASSSTWAVVVSADGVSLTPAAWWCLLVSSPIFWFLLLRGLWRHFVWSMLLRKIAGLRLRLISTHPDRMGGLGFLGQYPNAYATFVFAISCVVAAAVAKELMAGRLSPNHYTVVMGGWLVIVLALFVYPLHAFRQPLSKLKEETLLVYGAQATRYHRLMERKLVGRNIGAPEDAEAASRDEVPDPSKPFDTARKLSVLLVSRSALVPVCAAALVPLAVAGITKLPFKEMLSVLKHLLLL